MTKRISCRMSNYPPASKANLTERKNVCLSVTNFDPNYLRTGKQNGLKKFRISMAKTHVSKIFMKECFVTILKVLQI